jgi:predicted transcriptional regulator
MKKTTLYLPEDLDRAAKAVARAQNRSMADVIREAIASFVEAGAAIRPASVGAGRGPGGASVVDHEAEWLAAFGRR